MTFAIGDSVLFHEVNPGSPEQTYPRAAVITDVYGSVNDPQYALVYFTQEAVYVEGLRPSAEPQANRFTARPTPEVPLSEPFSDKIFIGKMVHYQSYGTPNGEYTPQPRAAMITQLGPEGDYLRLGITVYNPTGTFHQPSIPYAPEPTPGHWNLIPESADLLQDLMPPADG